MKNEPQACLSFLFQVVKEGCVNTFSLTGAFGNFEDLQHVKVTFKLSSRDKSYRGIIWCFDGNCTLITFIECLTSNLLPLRMLQY